MIGRGCCRASSHVSALRRLSESCHRQHVTSPPQQIFSTTIEHRSHRRNGSRSTYRHLSHTCALIVDHPNILTTTPTALRSRQTRLEQSHHLPRPQRLHRSLPPSLQKAQRRCPPQTRRPPEPTANGRFLALPQHPWQYRRRGRDRGAFQGLQTEDV